MARGIGVDGGGQPRIMIEHRCADMKRFTSTEFGMLILSLLFVVVGVATFINPKAFYMHYPAPDNLGIGPLVGYPVQVTRGGARVYAVIPLAFGIGLAVFVIFPRRK